MTAEHISDGSFRAASRCNKILIVLAGNAPAPIAIARAQRKSHILVEGGIV